MSAAILLMGPTGAGKSDAALALAERFPVEIVSVDSALVYRGLDIGAAKPSAATRAKTIHHLIDICDPSERYSVSQFLDDATRVMCEIEARGRTPLLVGGTMLYARALQSGLAALPPADAAIRERLTHRAEREGWPALHQALARIDPESAARIQPADGQRIQRALEVFELTGVPLTRLHAEDLRGASARSFLKLVLGPPDRHALDRRLTERFDAMLQAGLLEEVRALFERGDLDASLPAIRAVGYRQLWAHLAGECRLETARDEAIRATLKLAKRQYTWLRAEPGAAWLGCGREAETTLARQVADWLGQHRVI